MVTRPRILLADDHMEMRESIVQLLQSEFEMLEPVKNGFALLEAAAKLEPDVCLLDISMPIINGIEVASRLRRRSAKCKVVFLTIHDDIDFVKAALATGALGYVVKPRMASDLKKAIREALAGRVFISPR